MRFEPTYDDEPTTVFFKEEELPFIPASRPAQMMPAQFVAAEGTPPRGHISIRSYEVHAQDVPAIAQVPRDTQSMRWRAKSGIGFAVVCLVIGTIAGGVIAFGSNNGSVASARPRPVAPTAHLQVTPIVVAPVAHVLHVESQPAGAAVMRIDDGNTTLLGTTPLDIQIDETKGHDLVLTLDNYTPEFMHFNATDTKLAATLKAEAPDVAPAPVAAPVVARTTVHHHHAAPVVPTAPAAPTAMGHVNIASKPPCKIVIDGKATGFTTPQRSLELSVGHHEVTFINATEGIHLTAAVDVTATKTATLVQDFTQ
jgi:hypothetical protein